MSVLGEEQRCAQSAGTVSDNDGAHGGPPVDACCRPVRTYLPVVRRGIGASLRRLHRGLGTLDVSHTEEAMTNRARAGRHQRAVTTGVAGRRHARRQEEGRAERRLAKPVAVRSLVLAGRSRAARRQLARHQRRAR